MSIDNLQVPQTIREKLVNPPFGLPGISYQSAQTIPAKSASPAIAIEGLATGTPECIIKQSEAAKFLSQLKSLKKNQKLIKKLYQNTGIDTRHLAVNLLSEEVFDFSQQPGNIQARMEMFQKIAIPLAEQVAKKALAVAATDGVADSKEIVDSIGLVVFVTSTGFVAPGVDVALIERLGLRRNTARVTVNFMGCAAAMNGIRIAADRVKAYPNEKALVVCLELSSINAVFKDDLNDVIIHSLFGDGCAAVVIGARDDNSIQQVGKRQGKIIIRDHLSYLVEDTQDGIALGVRDNGITCTLSRQLPDYIQSRVGSIVESFLSSNQLTKAEIDLWAVHPGGPRIIQKVQSSLDISDEQTAASWFILQKYGNLLSAAILFVLEHMLHNCTTLAGESTEDTSERTGIAFSFSPGVGVEGFLFEVI